MRADGSAATAITPVLASARASWPNPLATSSTRRPSAWSAGRTPRTARLAPLHLLRVRGVHGAVPADDRRRRARPAAQLPRGGRARHAREPGRRADRHADPESRVGSRLGLALGALWRRAR